MFVIKPPTANGTTGVADSNGTCTNNGCSAN
jgi:hypothetical protein